MADCLSFVKENEQRISAVEKAFRLVRKGLAKPGRVLVGEGQLLKLCRRKRQPKMFFLFNDVLVYGSIVIPGRLYKKQRVIPLEHLVLEDLPYQHEWRHSWTLRTPFKSFVVSAHTAGDKEAWIKNIQRCCEQQLLQQKSEFSPKLAATWIPDSATEICMRCCRLKFSFTKRRHHCRRCGFVVCARCSRGRSVLPHISHKPKRVCWFCQQDMQEEVRLRGVTVGSSESNGSDGIEMRAWSGEEEEVDEDNPVSESSSDEDSDEDDEDVPRAEWVSSWSPYMKLSSGFHQAS